MMHWTVLTPALAAILVGFASSWSNNNTDSNATIYRYPRAMSLILIVCSAVMFTMVLWPGVIGDRSAGIGIVSFSGVFFLIGVALEFFRITVLEYVITQGYWPLKNVIWFKDVASVQTQHRVRDSFLRVTLKNGKQYKFESSIENFDGLCQRVVKLARVHGIADVVTDD